MTPMQFKEKDNVPGHTDHPRGAKHCTTLLSQDTAFNFKPYFYLEKILPAFCERLTRESRRHSTAIFPYKLTNST